MLALLCTLALLAPEPPAQPVLTLWDCDSTLETAGLELETRNVKQGRAAVRWRNHPQHPAFDVPGLPADWSGYHLLKLQLFTEKPLKQRFMVLIGSENPATEGPDYWGYDVYLDFTGWKELALPLGLKAGAREPLGWDQISGLSFSASGWGNTPNPDADLLIDDVRLVYDPPRPGPRMTDAQFFAGLDLDRPDLAKVKAAVDAGDLGAAKEAFLARFRERTSPQWWFGWRERPPVAPVAGGSDGWDYFGCNFKVDFTGWKLIRIPFKDWYTARRPLGWSRINALSMSSTYGDRTPSPQTVLAFDTVRLEGKQPFSLGDFEDDADLHAWGDLPASAEHVKEGTRAMLWHGLPQRHDIKRTDLPHDWTGYDALSFWVWSGAATGDQITILADSDTPDTRAADLICQHVYDGYQLGNPINWDANKYDPQDPAFTPEWTYSLNRFYHWRTLGQAYWASGDERYAKEWIAQMRSWVAANPYLLMGTGNNTGTWRTIEAGIRTSTTWQDCLQYFLGSPSLTGDDLVMFMKSWIEHAHHLMRITTEHPEHGGNWVTMECNGLGHLGIMLPEAKDAALWRQTAFDRMTQELDRQVYPDGAQKELTTGYHQVSRTNFEQLFRIARLNGIAMPAEYLQRLARMFEYNLKVMDPGGQLPPLNDAGYTGVLPSLLDGAELFGREDFRWGGTLGAQGKPVDYTSIALPWAGWYVMRSGWQPDDRWLLFESGPFGTGHQHEDKLSLCAYAYGRAILTEAGTYSYDHSKYRRYVLGTWAHNTILPDGQEQHRAGLPETYESRQPCDNLWLHNSVFDAADGVYDDGYGPKRELQIAHERTVVFVRPDYWVALDRLRAAGRHRYDILWNLNNDEAASDPQTLAGWGADEGKANLLVTPASTEGLSLSIVKGRDDPPLGFAPASRRRPSPV
ncbi:MAG: heparinase II/III family protein, partial [Armatimonadetes bacterium]|nr:heparinase II/III family protein [Armatimonadota bacterium]